MEQVSQGEQVSHPVFRTVECPEYSSAVFKFPFFKYGDVPYSFRQGHSDVSVFVICHSRILYMIVYEWDSLSFQIFFADWIVWA